MCDSLDIQTLEDSEWENRQKRGKRVRMIRLVTILNYPRDYKGGASSDNGKRQRACGDGALSRPGGAKPRHHAKENDYLVTPR